MSQVINDAPNDFWRPPVVSAEVIPVVAKIAAPLLDACNCGAEFMVGAHYCYLCGSLRRPRTDTLPGSGWTRFLEFQYIKRSLGLPIVPLAAFLIGLGCLLAALLVGTIYSVQNFSDFQAVQFWRMQWLLGAIASFVAAILLKRAQPESK
jgi:hypothetical protein